MYEKTVLRIAHMENSTDLLGPFNRFAIWVHGCCFDCDGCLAKNTRFGSYEELDIVGLSRQIIDSNCEGLTISGGEPFLQSETLAALLSLIKPERDIGVIVYSGFTLKEIHADPKHIPLLSQTDILIDGRYKKELDDGRAYIGSSNQQIHYLTDRYEEVGKKYYAQKNRRAEIKFTQNQAILIGIPSKNVLEVWQNIKAKSGGSSDDF